MAFCSNCGSQLNQNENPCKKCGALSNPPPNQAQNTANRPVQQAAPINQNPAQPNRANAPSNAQYAPNRQVTPQQNPPNFNYPPPAPPKKSGKGCLIAVLVVVGVVVLSIIGLVVLGAIVGTSTSDIESSTVTSFSEESSDIADKSSSEVEESSSSAEESSSEVVESIEFSPYGKSMSST